MVYCNFVLGNIETGLRRVKFMRGSTNITSSTFESIDDDIVRRVKQIITSKLQEEQLYGVDLQKTTSWENGTGILSIRRNENNNLKITNANRTQPLTTLGENISPSNARNILIASSARTGSSFLGELLSRYPGVFYSYEPLNYITNTPLEGHHENEMVNLAKQIFECKPPFQYFDHAKIWKAFNKNEEWKLLRPNFRLWNACESLINKESVFDVKEIYYSICPIFPIRVIKSIKMPVMATEYLLTDADIGKSLKIIVLVRDPRAVMLSRSKMSWKKDQMQQTDKVCEKLHSDVMTAFELKKKYPGQLFRRIVFTLL